MSWMLTRATVLTTPVGSEVVDQSGLPEPSDKRPNYALTDWAPFLAVVAQLGLLLWLVWMFHIESESFGRLMTIACAGFLIHHFLPLPPAEPGRRLLSDVWRHDTCRT